VSRLAAVLAVAFALAACDRNAPPLTGTESPPTSAPPPASVIPSAAGIRFIERLTGGAGASDPLPLIVAIHGRGGRPERIGRIFDSFEGRARLVLPYGFESVGDGFAWFSHWSDDLAFADETRSAADRVAAMIAEIARVRPTVGKPVVTGFSQGGILSFTLAVLHPELVRAAFPAGGFLAPALYPSVWPKGLAMSRLHAFHGTNDETVPVTNARATVQRLKEIGVPAELTEYPGVQHRISKEMQHDMMVDIEAAVSWPPH
jgi:phospholipase/carboxylesterase